MRITRYQTEDAFPEKENRSAFSHQQKMNKERFSELSADGCPLKAASANPFFRMDNI
jgi:hypothetical protein